MAETRDALTLKRLGRHSWNVVHQACAMMLVAATSISSSAERIFCNLSWGHLDSSWWRCPSQCNLLCLWCLWCRGNTI